MNTYTYHKDIRTILAAVGNVFGGMTISRMVGDEESPTFDNITVPVVYAPKTRTLNELVNTSKHIKLPIMCYDLKSVQYDAQRNFNKLDGYLVANRIDWTNSTHPMPLPVKMQLTSSFICRFQEDCHQYITCLFTYFAPYVEISYKHPDLDTEVRCRVIWDGNAAVNAPEQLNGTEPYRVTVDASFTVESWLYKNDEFGGKPIFNIPLNFTALPELSDNYDWMTGQRRKENTDSGIRLGRPLLWYTATDTVDVSNPNSEILVKGDTFKLVNAVYVVDMNPDDKMFSTDQYKSVTTSFFEYDFDGKKKSDERIETTFSGVPTEFEVVDDHRLLVKIPTATKSGRFDVYAVSKCGVGKLSEDSERPYRKENPLPTTNGINGIKISGD